MKVYSITYDLKKPGRNYSGLYDAIKSYNHWWHYLGSTWMVATDSTPEQIWEVIRPHIDRNDSVLIIEVKNNKSGWLPKEAWNWLNDNIPYY